jgi:hypothetical protein
MESDTSLSLLYNRNDYRGFGFAMILATRRRRRRENASPLWDSPRVSAVNNKASRTARGRGSIGSEQVCHTDSDARCLRKASPEITTASEHDHRRCTRARCHAGEANTCHSRLFCAHAIPFTVVEADYTTDQLSRPRVSFSHDTSSRQPIVKHG